ncbi:MAG: GNAT family N-acetyltransferase [Anaerolineales bacterium]|jgi:hypothetical protein
MEIRNTRTEDFRGILQINEESVNFLSPLSRERLGDLHRRAAYSRVMESNGAVAAFLLAFREGADYDSPNYGWFSERYGSFLYIDRVVVHPHHRRKGAAGLLYRDLFEYAAQSGVAVITCEVDIFPPNPLSLRFHRRRGFSEVGRQWIGDGKKQVSLMEKRIGGER